MARSHGLRRHRSHKSRCCYPKLGSVRLSEIAVVRGKLGLPAERDLWFEADKPLSAYAKEAARLERINA